MPRHGENIYKRKDGRWEGRYIKCRDPNNKAQYASVYAHSYSDVKAKLSRAKNEIRNQSIAVEKDTAILEEYALQWLNEVQSQVKHSTFVKYSNIVKNHIAPTMGSVKINGVSTEIVRAFANELMSSGNIQNKKGLSAKTVMNPALSSRQTK